MKYTIEIPSLPPVECSPNWRGHWSERYKATHTAKEQAWFYGRQIYTEAKPIAIKDVKGIHYIFHVKNHKWKDTDNLIGRAKPFLDGLKGSVIEDDHGIPISGEIIVDGTSATTIIVEVRNA